MEQADISFIAQAYNKSIKLIGTLLESKISDPQVSFDMFMIMHIIEQSGSEPITLSEIAETQEVTKSAISRKVGTLLDLGLIEQKSDRVDRRKKYLTLTNRGRELYWKNDKIFKEMLDDVAKRYGKDGFLKTLEHINKIVEVIKDTMED
ncbi:MarR family transcriptional regulator [Pediococcus acidilactici]|uniref:MarR family transcriptional regulator n=1 Tax=Pediococcus acidilactici TaxID=1254 RepID=UPI00097F4AF9|nr:MarR family transcriptional regulator [Pediococcus acidilactici]QDJ23187.1 transcriptional regulator [Pediococcus acidilactici]SJM45877.1 transcription regulator (putative) [Pediococcus acidilactici]